MPTERIEVDFFPGPLHILIRGDVEAGQIGVKSTEADHGPH